MTLPVGYEFDENDIPQLTAEMAELRELAAAA